MLDSIFLRKAIALVFVCIAVFIPAIQAAVRSSIASPFSDVTPFVPDFAISASPNSMTLPVGSARFSVITVLSTGGFIGNVFFEASSGVLEVSLDEPNVTLTSGGSGIQALTVFAPTSAPPGNYTVTVEGLSGCSQLHTASLKVQVTGPDFTISSVKTLLAAPLGGSDSTTLDLASEGGFSGPVDLFLFSQDLTPTFSPLSVQLAPGETGSSLLTITVSPFAQPGNYSLGVVSSSGPLLHALSIDLTIRGPGFAVSASPSFLTATAGGASNRTTITVRAFGGFTGLVSLAISSSPLGLDTTISPSSITLRGASASTLTVAAPAGAMPGSYLVTVTVSTATSKVSVEVFVTVKGPDFELSANPTFLTVGAGGSTCTSAITVISLNGFVGIVSLVNSTSPSGLTLSLSSTSIAGSGTSTLTVSAPAHTVPGSYFAEVNGTSGTLSEFASIVVFVTGPDFSVTADHSFLSITAPSSGTATATSAIAITYLNGFASAVNLDASVSSVNLRATISPSSVSSSGIATLTIDVAAWAISGVYTVVVTGTSGSLSHLVFVSVTVIAPDFTIDVSPNPLTISPLTPGTSTITITGLDGFTDSVSLSVVSPLNLNASIAPASISGSGTAILSVNSTVPGTYIVDVEGFTGSLFHSASVSVTVTGPDFSLSASPSSPTISAGSSFNSTISATALNGFSEIIHLTTTLSSGLTATLNVSSITPSQAAKLTILVGADTVPGTYSVNVTGTSGPLSHSAIITVTTLTPDFTLSSNPTSLTITAGGSAPLTITVASARGFTGTVTLSATMSPAGPIVSIGTSTIVGGSGTSILAVTVESSVSMGSYKLTIQGLSGLLSHLLRVSVTVTAASGVAILGLPVTTFYGLIASIIIAVAAGGLYFVRIRRRTVKKSKRRRFFPN